MSDATDPLTIAEYARRKGCSRQTVYNKLDTVLAPYIIIKYGKKLIDPQALAVKILYMEQDNPKIQDIFNVETETVTPIDIRAKKKESVKLVKRNDTLHSAVHDNVQLNMILDDLHTIEQDSYRYGALPSRPDSRSAADCLIDVIRGQEEQLKEKDKQLRKMQSTINDLITMLNDERTYNRQLSNDFTGIAHGMLVVNHDLLTYSKQTTVEKPKRKQWGIVRFILKLIGRIRHKNGT